MACNLVGSTDVSDSAPFQLKSHLVIVLSFWCSKYFFLISWTVICNPVLVSLFFPLLHTFTIFIFASCSCIIFCLWRDSPPVGQGFLIYEVSISHTTAHHSWQDSSGRVISSSQRPLPDNTQHSLQTSMPRVRFEPTTSAGERSQTYTLDRAANGTGVIVSYCC